MLLINLFLQWKRDDRKDEENGLSHIDIESLVLLMLIFVSFI